jgi:hypothetical protein
MKERLGWGEEAERMCGGETGRHEVTKKKERNE